MYIIALEMGMVFFIRLAVYRKCIQYQYLLRVLIDISKIFKVFRNLKRRSATSSLKVFVDTRYVIPSLL